MPGGRSMSGAGVAAMQSRCSMSEIIGRTVRPVGMQVMDAAVGCVHSRRGVVQCAAWHEVDTGQEGAILKVWLGGSISNTFSCVCVHTRV